MLSDEIKPFFKGEVSEDAEVLQKYSHDASIFEIKPEVVVFPKDSEDIKSLVKFVSDAKKGGRNLYLTPRSGGTDMTGGPLGESIVVDMTKYFNVIHEIGPDYVVTDPGVYYRDLDKETQRRDLIMPAYPASREIATVGGMVANDSGGEKTPAYGKVEKFVKELSVVLADGNEYVVKPLTKKELEAKLKLPTFEGQLYKQMYELISANQQLITQSKPNVTKNSAGYYLWNVYSDQSASGELKFDFTQLITGSQGTLGIITKIKFGLVRVKPISKMAVMFLKRLDHLGEAIVDISKLGPESLESYDDRTLRLAMRFFRDIMKILKPKHFFSMVWGLLPEVWAILTGGMPKLVVLAEFTGDKEEEVDAKLAQVASHMKQFGIRTHITSTREEANEYWVVRRESFNLLRNKVTSKRAAPFIDDFSVLPEVLPKFLPRLASILGKYKLIYTINGHPGDGNFHIIPLMDLNDQAQRAIIPQLSEEVYDLVAEFKGSITAEHNDGLIRTPYLHKMYSPEILKMFDEVKKLFDPLNIFNPGKKVNGSLPYALSHIKRTHAS